MRYTRLAIILVTAGLAGCLGSSKPSALPALDATSAAAWRAYVQPTPHELRWQQIPWLPSFADGLAAARDQDRPLLLWVMNGHPLGCT